MQCAGKTDFPDRFRGILMEWSVSGLPTIRELIAQRYMKIANLLTNNGETDVDYRLPVNRDTILNGLAKVIDYLGTERNDYAEEVGARWLTSAVARIYRPGAKADCCLILEGRQGLKKSTALRTIAGEWFTDEIADLGSKDAAMQTRGVWIIEIAELDSLGRPEVSKVKAFMSRACDRFRPPYGRRLIESPRQCVFAGSVNQSSYLRDETGGRRFWPASCTRILIDELARDRDQLWAEAVLRFRGGSVWWLDSVELNRIAQQEQSDRYEGNPWDEVIAFWLEHPTARNDCGNPIAPFTSNDESVSIHDVLLHCVGKRQELWTQCDVARRGVGEAGLAFAGRLDSTY